MYYVELDLETEEPRVVCGKFAVQKDGEIISEHDTFQEAQLEADRLNDGVRNEEITN